MSEHRILEFSIAPVQSFVGQARRIRDYWAGSYLLSYLTAHAMFGVSDGDPEWIRFPRIHEDLLWKTLTGSLSSDKGPSIASLPNRFTAICNDPAVAGQKGAEALQKAWERIVDAVWKKVREVLQSKFSFRLPELNDSELPETWKKQLFNLWEIYWVDEGPESSPSWSKGMNQRKNWRKPLCWEERGEMCTVCGERVVAFGEGLSRPEVRRLWHQGENSICKILNQHREQLGDAKLQWKLVMEDNDRERLCSVCLVKRVFPYIAKHALGWDLEDNRIYIPSTHEFAAQLGKNLQDEPVNPYYAVLLMDGDKLGEKLRDYPKQRGSISEAIAAFSREVPMIVEGKWSGRVVYAGGDDVLAFLPLHKALDCATELRNAFMNQQRDCHLEESKITISAAILMIHMISPLQPILRTAHRLLDEVAKDGIGRDAFVLQVQKRSGPSLTIAKPWYSANCPDDYPDWLITMKKLSGQVFQAETEMYSRKFLHSLTTLLEPLNTPDGSIPFDKKTVINLMTSEYLNNRDLKWETNLNQKQIWEKARKRMEHLYHLGLLEKRSSAGIEYGHLQTDIFEILHFLAGAEVRA